MFSLNMLDSSMFSLLLSTCVFCAEQVEGVILAHKILETAQSPNSSLSLLFDFGNGLGTSCQQGNFTVTWYRQMDIT